MYLALLLTATFLFHQYGCAHEASDLKIKLESKLQRDTLIDDWIEELGSPNGTNTLSDGRTVYTWQIPWVEKGINYGVPGGQAYTAHHWCTIVITTSPSNSVLGHNFRDC